MEKEKIKYTLAGAALFIMFLLVGSVLGGSLGKKSNLEKAFNKLLEADTYYVKAGLDMNLALTERDKASKPFTTATVKVEGDVSYNEEDIPELAGKLYMESKGRGNVLFVDGDARILADQVAFRLDNLPTLMNNSVALVDKWTYVDTPVMKTNNKESVIEAFRLVVQDVSYAGKEKLNGGTAYRYAGEISDENKERLIGATSKGNSGNSALHVLTRLLKHNKVKSFDIWVDKGSLELSLIRLEFVRPLAEGEADFATLDLAFSDYSKTVVIDRPEVELTVEPHVFSRMFGEGEMELQASH